MELTMLAQCLPTSFVDFLTRLYQLAGFATLTYLVFQPFEAVYEQWQIRQTMKVLWKIHPTRFPMDFERLQKELPEEFYEKLYQDLFAQANKVARDMFGLDDLPSFELLKAARKLSPELLKHIGEIARADPLTGSWNGLFACRDSRTYLCQAILMRVLYTHVFSSLLFGATRDQELVLENHDKRLIEIDGKSTERRQLILYPNLSIIRL